jgi:hypothetical protein
MGVILNYDFAGMLTLLLICRHHFPAIHNFPLIYYHFLYFCKSYQTNHLSLLIQSLNSLSHSLTHSLSHLFKMKFIVVTGGVVSGIGKGITISSIGRLLKSSNLSVTSIKIDPYLNVDAGTMSPYEHGEAFVLNDGGETDLDLGNYERFLDVNLSGRHNITTGKIYQEVSECVWV